MAADISIEDLLGDVPGSTGYRFAATDSAGHRMDTVKIIPNPSGGYLSVFHTGDEVHVATSTDVLNWEYRCTLDGHATQPTICSLPTGGFLTAVEYNNQRGSGGRLRLRHYPSLDALLTGAFDRERTPRRKLSRCHEGTPTILSVSLDPDIDHSVIEVGLHYHRNCDVDRQARGTLTDFANFVAAPDPAVDELLNVAAAAQGQVINGNIGDRDTAEFDGVSYTLYEVQYVKGDFGTWRVYLRNVQAGVTDYLPIVTPGASTAFANPTITSITSPSGKPAMVATLFLPSEGAAAGEGGPLIYYREYAAVPDPGLRPA